MARRDASLSKYVQHLEAVPMFAACSKKDLRLLAQRAEHLEVEAGRALVTEGTTGREFFVIVSGEAVVTRRGRKLATLGPGDFFGELALLAKTPRNATVTTKTPTEVVVLGRPEFDGVVQDVPAITRKLLVGMATRLAEVDMHV